MKCSDVLFQKIFSVINLIIILTSLVFIVWNLTISFVEQATNWKASFASSVGISVAILDAIIIKKVCYHVLHILKS